MILHTPSTAAYERGVRRFYPFLAVKLWMEIAGGVARNGNVRRCIIEETAGTINGGYR
jgi:hypothetical protein